MKRLLYGILILAVLLVGVTFTTKNAQVVELNYYFGIHWVTPLSFMMLTTLTIGIALGLLASLRVRCFYRCQVPLFSVNRSTEKRRRDWNILQFFPDVGLH